MAVAPLIDDVLNRQNVKQAAQEIQTAVKERKTRFLPEMATGTGKTNRRRRHQAVSAHQQRPPRIVFGGPAGA